jgi:hypothetical protein
MEKTRKQILLGSLSAGLVVLGIGVSAFLVSHGLPRQWVEPQQPPAGVATAALQADVLQLLAERNEFTQLATKLTTEVDTLRQQLHQIDARQAAMASRSEQLSEQEGLGKEELELSPEAVAEVEAVALTPEEEEQQIADQTQAQIELMEATVLREAIDPEWAPSAQKVLKETFQQEALSGMYLVDADCRTSLCRMEVVFDETLAPEDGFRMLTDNSPWQGQGFVRIGTDEDPSIMVYLAREGHSLPQAQESLSFQRALGKEEHS